MVRLIGTGKSKYICVARSIGDTAATGIANSAVACNVSVTIPVTWTHNRTLLLRWLCGSNWMLCFSKTNKKWNHSSAMITLPFWIWLDQIWKTPDFWSNFLRCQLTGCIYANCSDPFYSIYWMWLWLHVLLAIRESSMAVWGSLCMSVQAHVDGA